MKIESAVQQVGYPQALVYAKISDLNNVAIIKERFNDPAVQERMKANIPSDKIESVKQNLETMQVDSDSVSLEVNPVGKIAIRIIDREEPKCIKFASVSSPVQFNLWIQLLPVTESTSKMKITVDADVPFFLKAMIEKPLREGIEKLAEMLATLPYE